MESKYQFAQKLIQEVGSYLRSQLGQDLVIEEKESFTDLVTHLDKLVQDRLSQAILAAYPSHVILAEESSDNPPFDKGSVWIIDPIDGTSNLIAQQADFAILLAYFEEGIGQFGLIYDVVQDRLYHGGGQFPVYENDRLLQVAKPRTLKTSLLGLNATLYAANYGGLRDLADQTLGTRSVGSAGIGFSHVLSGRLLAYASYLYPWDYAAAWVLGQALGYCLQTLDGSRPSFDGREYVILLPINQCQEIQGYLKECSYQTNL